MAREMMIVDWCDVHLRRDREKVEAQHTFTVIFDRVEREIAFCAACNAEISMTLGEWQDFLAEWGIKPGEAAKPMSAVARLNSDEFFCPVEDCDRHLKPFPSRASLRDHLSKIHRTSLRLIEGKRVVQLPCPVGSNCPMVSMGWAGLGSHIRGAHPEVTPEIAGKGNLRAWYNRMTAGDHQDRTLVGAGIGADGDSSG